MFLFCFVFVFVLFDFLGGCLFVLFLWLLFCLFVWLVGWLVGWCWFVRSFVRFSCEGAAGVAVRLPWRWAVAVSWLVGWSVGCLSGWLLAGWLVGGWLVGWLDGSLVFRVRERPVWLFAGPDAGLWQLVNRAYRQPWKGVTRCYSSLGHPAITLVMVHVKDWAPGDKGLAKDHQDTTCPTNQSGPLKYWREHSKTYNIYHYPMAIFCLFSASPIVYLSICRHAVDYHIILDCVIASPDLIWLCTKGHLLTYWGLVIFGSDNDLSPGRRQAIIWTDDGIFLIGPVGTNFSEILSEIHIFSFKKKLFKASSAKWRPFCLGLNMLTRQYYICIIRLCDDWFKIWFCWTPIRLWAWMCNYTPTLHIKWMKWLTHIWISVKPCC